MYLYVSNCTARCTYLPNCKMMYLMYLYVYNCTARCTYLPNCKMMYLMYLFVKLDVPNVPVCI